MEKIQLEQTLSEINRLNKEGLQALYTEVKGEAPAEELTKAQLLEEILEVADPAAAAPHPAKKEVPENGFEYEGKVYEVVLHAVIIPELGRRTAAEITVDEEAQAFLVKQGSGAIKEVL